MIGAVIASETTKHIKKSPPFLACFIAPSSPFDGIITLFVLRKRTLADTIQNTAHSRGQIVPCDMDVHWHCDRELMKDLKLRCSLFLSCPSSEDMMLAGEIQAQLHIIIILIRYYSHIFTTNISLPSCFPPTCLYLSSGYGTKGKLCLLFTDVCWRLSWIFLFPPLLIFYRSVGLKVHLFQLANDLFWAIGKYLSQLVLVLKSLRDGAEGSAKSINLSGNGDMIYAGRGAAPREQEDLAQAWKDEYTLLKIS